MMPVLFRFFLKACRIFLQSGELEADRFEVADSHLAVDMTLNYISLQKNETFIGKYQELFVELNVLDDLVEILRWFWVFSAGNEAKRVFFYISVFHSPALTGRWKAATSPVCSGMEDICAGRIVLGMIIDEACCFRKVEVQ